MNSVIPTMLLACTVRGAVLIALARLAGPAMRRFFGRNGAHWLWLAALAALLWPIPPRTPLSVQNLWATPRSLKADPLIAQQPEAAAKVGVSYVTSDPPAQIALPEPVAAAPQAESIPIVSSSQTFDPMEWLVKIWLVGVVLMLAQLSWRWWRTHQMLRETRDVSAGRALKLLAKFKSIRPVSLAVTSLLRAPAITGLWRPQILIPEGWLEELPPAELESVLLHELGHHRRGDLLCEWLFAIARCVHWMNPAVWLAERWSRRERELACDGWALERSSSPIHYGEALLAALRRVQRCPDASFGVIAMASEVREIAHRLEWICRYRPTPGRSAVAWLPAVLLLAAVGSDPMKLKAGVSPENPVADTTEPTPSPANDALPPASVAPLPQERRSVELILSQIRVPETKAFQVGWPIASEPSNGIQLVIPANGFRTVRDTLKSEDAVEFLTGLRLISQPGIRNKAQSTRELRYPASYNAPGPEGPATPVDIATTNFGMTLEWKADILPGNSVRLNLLPQLTRLAGFVETGGALTKPISPAAKRDWFQRLVAIEMPPGAAGQPSVVQQKGNSTLTLGQGDIGLIFGFRDIDHQRAAGNSAAEAMINYFAVQTSILQ